MKNLKRALALALSSIMLVGMMAVGAGAAGFGDADKIEHTDAVNTMVALGVIKGDDKGNFDPERTVTRAEMAKMVCVALNGGTDPNLAGGGLYPDTKGHWAAGYIDYCTNMGIVSGDNHGNFNPDKTVTGTEAAKMMLMAMGYNAQTEKFVNDANWAININVLASTRGLYKNVNSLPDAGLTRDNAAQLIFNGVQANMVRYELVGIVGGNGVSQAVEEKGKTVLSEKYETYTTAPEGVMSSFTYSSAKDEFTYAIGGVNFKSEKDFTDLFGRKVRVIAQPAGDKEVFGVFAVDSTVLFEGFAGAVDQPTANAEKVKIDGTEYKIDGAAKNLSVIYQKTGTEAVKLDNIDALTGSYSIKVLDNDDNGKIDSIVVTPFTVAKVTYVGKTSLTMDKGVGSKDYDDVTVYDGVAKNDYVIFTDSTYTAKGLDDVAAADMQSGTITGSKSGKWMIDGEWMTNKSGETLNVNDTIDYIAFGSVIYYAKVTDGDSYTKDLAFVYNATAGTGEWDSAAKPKVALMFMDGSKKSVVTDAHYTGLVGKLVTYRLNNDDEYVLAALSSSNLAGYDAYGTTAPEGTGATIDKVGGYQLADDAVVFLYKWKVTNAGTANADNNVKIITGKDAKELKVADYDGTGSVAVGEALSSKVNGFNYAKVATLVPDTADKAFPDSFTGNNYGYLTSDAYRTVKDGKNYLNFTLWTGEEELTVTTKTDDAASDFKAGTIVTYDTVDSTTVKNVKAADTTIAAVTGYDEGADKVQFHNSTVAEIVKDTTVMYVNSKKTDGVNGGSIELAEELTAGGYVNNVRYITNTAGDELVLLVVDVNNKMEVGPARVLDDKAATAAQIEAALAATKNVTLGANLTGTQTINVAAGQTLNVAAAQDQKQTIKLASGAKLNVGADLAFKEDSVIEVEDGATVTFGDREVVGGNGLTSSDKITLKLLAGGKLEYTLAADATLNGTLELTAGDKLTGAHKISGAEGAKIIVYKGTHTGAWTIDTLTVVADGDDTVSNATLPATANKVYTWTLGDVVNGWVASDRV